MDYVSLNEYERVSGQSKLSTKLWQSQSASKVVRLMWHKPNAMQTKKKFKNVVLVSLGILYISLLAYAVVYKGATKFDNGLQPYKNAELITLARGAPISERKYAYADGIEAGKFIFREREGETHSLRIRLHKTARLVVKSSVRYDKEKCGENGENRAHLSISSPHVQSVELMVTGQMKQLDFVGYAGSYLSVGFLNEVTPKCGLVALQFFEKNRVRDYPVAFTLIWLTFFLAAFAVKLPLSTPILGASINATLVLTSTTIGIDNAKQLFTTSFWSIGLCGAMLVIYGLVAYRPVRTILLSLLLLSASFIPLIFGGHYLAFDAPPGVDTFHAMLQSHLNQAIEFWTDELGWKYILGVVFGLCVTVAISFLLTKPSVNRLACLGVGLLLLAINFRDLPTNVDSHPFFRIPVSAYASYFQELSAFQELQAKRSASPDKIVASTEQRDSTLVVVIGESANKWHMSSYAYPRETTPAMDRFIASGNMLKFNSAYSNHIYSNPTISKALTEADNYNDLQWSSTPSVMNVANAAGVHTTWVSNKLKLGPWDSVMSVIGDDANETIHINKKVGQHVTSKHLDEALVPLVERALRKKRGNRLMFVHLQGSHVSYGLRYPASHGKFQKAADFLTFGDAIFHPRYHPSVLNHYDNSIYYTDYVLEKILRLLELENQPTAMLYFSDHGESVFRRNSHNATRFEYEMSEIPMLFWANQVWQNTYNDAWTNLKANIDKVFTNDHIFETTLGLLGIKSRYTHVENDLSSANYSAPVEPSTLHSTKLIASEDNWSFWVRPNFNWLRSKYPTVRLATRANSLAHVNRALFDGVDKVYLPAHLQGDNLFITGSQSHSFTVDEFLSNLDENQQKQITIQLDSRADLSKIKSKLNAQHPMITVDQSLENTVLDLSAEHSYQDMRLKDLLTDASINDAEELILSYKSNFSID